MPNVVYVGDHYLGEKWGTVPLYTDEYMPPDRLYIIGIPEKEPSGLLVGVDGRSLLVPNSRKLKKIGVISPDPGDRITIVDYTEHEP